MRSYRPEELFDESGRLIPELRRFAPTGTRRMSANPHANGGLLKKAFRLPDFRNYAIKVEKPGQTEAENTRPLGAIPARRDEAEHEELPRLRPRRKHLEQARRQSTR